MKKIILLTSLCGGLLFAGIKEASALKIDAIGIPWRNKLGVVGDIMQSPDEAFEKQRQWVHSRLRVPENCEVAFEVNGQIVNEFTHPTEYDFPRSAVELTFKVVFLPKVTYRRVVINSADWDGISSEAVPPLETSIAEIKRQVGGLFGYNSEDQFEITFNGSVCDEDMTLGDLADGDSDLVLYEKSKIVQDVPAQVAPRPRPTQAPAAVPPRRPTPPPGLVGYPGFVKVRYKYYITDVLVHNGVFSLCEDEDYSLEKLISMVYGDCPPSDLEIKVFSEGLGEIQRGEQCSAYDFLHSLGVNEVRAEVRKKKAV